MKDIVMIRVSRDLLARLRDAAAKHPLKPTLRATVERAIELMIDDLEEEMNNGNR